jgi:hypothetical protein
MSRQSDKTFVLKCVQHYLRQGERNPPPNAARRWYLARNAAAAGTVAFLAHVRELQDRAWDIARYALRKISTG